MTYVTDWPFDSQTPPPPMRADLGEPCPGCCQSFRRTRQAEFIHLPEILAIELESFWGWRFQHLHNFYEKPNHYVVACVGPGLLPRGVVMGHAGFRRVRDQRNIRVFRMDVASGLDVADQAAVFDQLTGRMLSKFKTDLQSTGDGDRKLVYLVPEEDAAQIGLLKESGWTATGVFRDHTWPDRPPSDLYRFIYRAGDGPERCLVCHRRLP